MHSIVGNQSRGSSASLSKAVGSDQFDPNDEPIGPNGLASKGSLRPVVRTSRRSKASETVISVPPSLDTDERIMVRNWFALFTSVAAGCGAATPQMTPLMLAAAPACDASSKAVFQGDSDVGWGGVEEIEGCEGKGGAMEGPAVETLESAPSLASTKRVGRYLHGRRAGTWTQYDSKTGRVLGSFTLDARGTGTEIVFDQLGHFLRGTVIEGRREGTWTYYDRDGTPVARETFSHGAIVHAEGRVDWDPPMVDLNDRCPDVTDAGPPSENGPIDEEGCPLPLQSRSPAASPIPEAGPSAK
jgi:hypothetical protein